jgi:hypothetical protein
MLVNGTEDACDSLPDPGFHRALYLLSGYHLGTTVKLTAREEQG